MRREMAQVHGQVAGTGRSGPQNPPQAAADSQPAVLPIQSQSTTFFKQSVELPPDASYDAPALLSAGADCTG